MGVENELLFDPGEEAAIVDYFSEVGRGKPEDLVKFYEKLESYIPTHGPLHFASLEKLFRKNNFNIYLVALPSEVYENADPDAIVVDPNDLYFHDTVTRKPFVLGISSSLEEVQAGARQCNFIYKREENLAKLRHTGIARSKEQLESDGRLVNLSRLGLKEMGPVWGRPKDGSPPARLAARWN